MLIVGWRPQSRLVLTAHVTSLIDVKQSTLTLALAAATLYNPEYIESILLFSKKRISAELLGNGLVMWFER